MDNRTINSRWNNNIIYSRDVILGPKNEYLLGSNQGPVAYDVDHQSGMIHIFFQGKY